MRQVATTAVLLGSLLVGNAQAQQPAQPPQVESRTRQDDVNANGYDFSDVCMFDTFVTFYSLPELKPDFYTDTTHSHFLHDETVTYDGADQTWKIYSYANDSISSDRVILRPGHDDVPTVVYFEQWRVAPDHLPPIWRTKKAIVGQLIISDAKAAGDDVEVSCNRIVKFHFKDEELQNVESFGIRIKGADDGSKAMDNQGRPFCCSAASSLSPAQSKLRLPVAIFTQHGT